jgi:uncharacterized protein (DUF1015 family)
VKVRPFPALRPRPDLAHRIAAVPYDVVSTGEARALAAGNPLSFLHVSRPEIDLPEGTDPHDDAVYAKAVENFAGLRRNMLEEAGPSLYWYRLRLDAHTQMGLAACFDIDAYTRGVIRRHELTRRDKEDDRTRHVLDLRAQTGPVFLTYRHERAIDELARDAAEHPPLYDFTADDGVGHTVWRIGDAAGVSLAAAFERVQAMYIADGHHRAAAAARAHATLSRSAPAGDGAGHAAFLAVAFPDDQVRILPYNRVVRDLGALAPEAFLGAVAKRFEVRPGGAGVPSRSGECAMYVAGQWYRVMLRAGADGAGAPASAPADALDVSLLHRRLIEPLLGIVDLRADERIDFVGGRRGTRALEDAVSSGRAAAAFSMFPVTVGELMAVADTGAMMPPKSTWFEPKLRDGLLTHLI